MYKRTTLKDAAAKAKAFGDNPSSTMIGGNIKVLRDAWQASKDAGKVWQVWTGATVLAPQIPPSFLYCGKAVPFAFYSSLPTYFLFLYPSDVCNEIRVVRPVCGLFFFVT